MLFPQLTAFIEQLAQEQDLISESRKALLTSLSDYILAQGDETVQLNFICTHNSRRSHLSQIWAATAAAHYGIENIKTFSAGTEATAFNHRAVAALERVGFQIDNPGGDNPHYLLRMGATVEQMECFSKTIEDPANPSSDFAAIMTCSHADENCPIVFGADWRLALTYEDPKVADDTPQETERYDERVRQIGREILYAMQHVQAKVAQA